MKLMPQDSVWSTGSRRNAVLELLLEQEKVTVRDLVDRFDVSAMTVHRDLDALEARGVLRKVRGGATMQPTAVYEGSLAFRLGEQRDAKEAIARQAARRVTPGSSVVLDDSTTALAMLPHLALITQLTLVTNFVSIVEELSQSTDNSVTLIAIGGAYNHKYHAFGGVLAERALADLRVDLCFVSVAAIDIPRAGTFHQEADQAVIKRAMTEIADESVLLADATKFSKRALHRVVDIGRFDAAVVDEETGADDIAGLRSGGVAVEVASRSVLGDDGS
jgi:DeoR/GlpR family transcriptional regulator of sugar metabolism